MPPGLGAGVDFPTCDLCDGECDPNDGCIVIPGPVPDPNDPNSSSTVELRCELVIEDVQQLLAFLCQDEDPGDPNTCDNEFINVAEVRGAAVFDLNVCQPVEDVEAASTCQSRLRFVWPICWETKAHFRIWNQNEVGFSGTEQCFYAWRERLLTEWPDGSEPPGVPNHFLREYLQTDMGRARIDGVASQVCQGYNIDAPLLGAAAQILQIDDDPNEIAFSAAPIAGGGTQAGMLKMFDVEPGAGGGGHGPDFGPAGRMDALARSTTPLMRRSESGNPDALEPLDAISVGDDGFGLASMERGGAERSDASQKGSLLVFPKVEIKWDAQGDLIQDTILTLNNDWTEDVDVIVFLVNAEPPAGYPEDVCEIMVNNEFVLSGDEPAYWSALTGDPKGLTPFASLGSPLPDPDPRNPDGSHMHGYVIVWAVNADGQEIRWNHLFGGATIVNYRQRDAWEYTATSFQAIAADHGQTLLTPYGRLDLDGVEYDWAPAYLVLDFFAPGATIVSKDGHQATVLDTDLTLFMALNDFTDDD